MNQGAASAFSPGARRGTVSPSGRGAEGADGASTAILEASAGLKIVRLNFEGQCQRLRLLSPASGLSFFWSMARGRTCLNWPWSPKHRRVLQEKVPGQSMVVSDRTML